MTTNEFRARQADYTMAEYRRLQDCLQRWAVAGSPYHIEGVAGLWWGTYAFLPLDAENQVRIWEDAGGEVAGFALLEADFLTYSIAPEYRQGNELLGEILAWAAGVAKAHGHTDLHTWGQELEGDTCDFLEAQGLGLQDDPYFMIRFRQDLDGVLMELPPLEGMTLRQVAAENEAEIAERIEAHRDAFSPSRFTRELYDRVRSSPVYRPDLDIVAVTEDGTIASYCICWFDPVTQIGEFEPVGTREAYHGKGVGKRVMLEGLRRLKALGAEVATVQTGCKNVGGVKLYQSVGFEEADRAYLYVKGLG